MPGSQSQGSWGSILQSSRRLGSETIQLGLNWATQPAGSSLPYLVEQKRYSVPAGGTNWGGFDVNRGRLL